MKEFIIDGRWESNFGDWEIDENKFPHGLKPVFDYIKSLGMKPGLWISIGSAAPGSRVFKSHPEWFVRDKNGSFTSLHLPGDKERFTACFSTGWYGYIKNILLKLALDYGLEYMKLDFAVVTSPYVFDPHSLAVMRTTIRAISIITNLFMQIMSRCGNYLMSCIPQSRDFLLTVLLKRWVACNSSIMQCSNMRKEIGYPISTVREKSIDLRIRNMAWWRSPR